MCSIRDKMQLRMSTCRSSEQNQRNDKNNDITDDSDFKVLR